MFEALDCALLEWARDVDDGGNETSPRTLSSVLIAARDAQGRDGAIPEKIAVIVKKLTGTKPKTYQSAVTHILTTKFTCSGAQLCSMITGGAVWKIPARRERLSRPQARLPLRQKLASWL